MKKMCYKRIKILLLLLISLFIFQQISFCDQAEEKALITNLGEAKNKKQADAMKSKREMRPPIWPSGRKIRMKKGRKQKNGQTQSE